MEIERKWLIDINQVPYDLDTLQSYEIIQAYISFSPTIRIRQIDHGAKNILTIKSSSKDGGLSREEYEIEITGKQFDELLKKCEGKILSKTRYIVKEDGLKLEIDIFHDDYEGLCYMEIEFKDPLQAKEYPDPFWAKKDVTYNKRYTNASLARGTEIEY